MLRPLLLALLLGAPASARAAAPSPALADALARAGDGLGLSLDGKSRLLHASFDPKTGRPGRPEPLDDAAAARVSTFVLRLPSGPVEPLLGQALASYLFARAKPGDAGFAEFLVSAPGGGWSLTPLGRNALVDILAADDGRLLGGDPPPPAPASWLRKLQWKVQDSLSIGGGAESAPAAAFDGFRFRLPAFDWDAVERESSAAAGLKDVGRPALEGFAVDRDAGTVRVLIAAGRSARRDRLSVADERDAQDVLRESGLDAKLLAKQGAKVVRAIDNLVAVDVPLPKAAALGLELRRQGVASAPARLFRRAASVAREAAAGPALGLLGAQFAPVPSAALGTSAAGAAANLDSRARLKVDGLWGRGMEGQGATVGIIDTGLDASHPDLAANVAEYVDFTGEGGADALGHGTFVAGTVAGSGASSQGAYRGTAPKARLVVAKVFGTKGDATEDLILAAMKWMRSRKVDVLNMSLGGPGEPNADTIGAMANRLAVRDNVLLVAAAGNEGPQGETISSPGNARYALTVTGVDRDGRFPFFPSRGPVPGPDGYTKPDVATVAGGVRLPAQGAGQWARIVDRAFAPAAAAAQPSDPGCIYGPGIVSTRSKDDPDSACALAGNPRYRFFTGTSMAAPMASGVAADVIGYLKSQGAGVRAAEVRAALIETASDQGEAPEVQGGGLVDGARLAEAVVDRVRAGLPIGNIAYALALRLTSADRGALARQTRYRSTALGLLDTREGRLIRTDEELAEALRELRGGGDPPPQGFGLSATAASATPEVSDLSSATTSRRVQGVSRQRRARSWESAASGRASARS